MLVVQTTFASRKDAERIGEALVRARIAACAGITPCSSLFFWEGRLQKEREWLLELKVQDADFARAKGMIKEMHPYKLPQVIALPVARASREYARWAREAAARRQAKKPPRA